MCVCVCARARARTRVSARACKYVCVCACAYWYTQNNQKTHVMIRKHLLFETSNHLGTRWRRRRGGRARLLQCRELRLQRFLLNTAHPRVSNHKSSHFMLVSSSSPIPTHTPTHPHTHTPTHTRACVHASAYLRRFFVEFDQRFVIVIHAAVPRLLQVSKRIQSVRHLRLRGFRQRIHRLQLRQHRLVLHHM